MHKFYFSCLLLLTVLMYSTSNLLHAQDFVGYTDNQQHFKIKLPYNWKYIAPYKGNLFLAHRPLKQTGEKKVENVVLSIISDTSLKSLEHTVTNFGLAQKILHTDYEGLEQGKDSKGRYYWIVNRHTKEDTHEIIENLSVLYGHKGKYYVLQCTASASKFEEYRKIFMKIAESIEFL